MITSLTLDDAGLGTAVTLHRTSTNRLTGASGLLGIGPLRDVMRPRPTGHGGIDDTRWQGAQPISLEGVVLGTSNADAQTRFHPIAAAALSTLDYGASLLKWTEESGLALQRYVKLAGALDPALAPDRPRSVSYQLQLLAEDPRAYSQTLTTVTGGTVTSLSSCVNAGNRKTPPILRVYGSAVAAKITNVTTGEFIQLSGTIAASHFVELDVYNRRASLDGTAAASTYSNALVVAGSTTWWELAAGTSSVRMDATAYGTAARVDVLFRSAYV